MENNNNHLGESNLQWNVPKDSNESISWKTPPNPSNENNPTPSEVTWGEESNKEQSPWETPPNPSNENNPTPSEVTWGEESNEEIPSSKLDFKAPPQLKNSASTVKYSYLGDLERIKISTLHYQFKHNNIQAISDLEQANLSKLDDDGRYSFDPKSGTELGSIIESIYDISRQMGTKIGECFIYKNQPQESTLNIFKHKPSKTFVYFLQADLDSSQLILDLSSFGGPSAKIIDSCEGIFSVIPGWCDFRFTKNLSNTEFTAIVGYFK